MGAASNKRFTRVGTLKSIAPDHIIAFLGRFKEYFAKRCVAIPQSADAESMPYDEILKVLMEPDDSTPGELSEALYLIDEMSTPEGMDDLLTEAGKNDIAITGREAPTPADVAVQVWLANPSILERRHDRKAIERSKSFDYYHSAEAPTKKLSRISAATLTALQKTLDEWYDDRRCGRGCRVTPHHRGDEVWFTVEHGDQVVRTPARDGPKRTVHFYRPEKSDIVVYDCRLGEIRVNARTSPIKDQYRQAFGKHLFGDENFFCASGKYTLDPLFDDGEDALSVDGIDGIESAKLVEIQFDEGGSQGEVEVRKAHDLFAAWKDSKRALDRDRRIAHVKFEVKFAGSRKTRKVTLRPPNRATFGRDADSAVIEEWLAKNKFSKPWYCGGRQSGVDRVIKLDRLWKTLEAVPDLAATDLEWKSRLGADYRLAATFLVPRGEVAGSYPCPVQGHHGHRHRIIHDGDDRYAGVCDFCGESSHGRADVCIHDFNAAKLGKSVASAFGLQPADGDVPDAIKTYRVGTYVPRVGQRVPAFLTLQTRRKGFQAAADRIAALETSPFIVMAPTNTFFLPESETIIKQRMAHFVALEDVLVVNGRQQIASVVTIEQALAGSRKRRAKRGRRPLSAAERRRREKLWRGWEDVRGKAGTPMSEYCTQKGITPKQLESIGRQVRRARQLSSGG